MTLIDEEELRRVIGGAAERIEVPDGATERIVAASRTTASELEPRANRIVFPHSFRGRVIAVAASVAIVVGGISLLHAYPGGSHRPVIAAGSANPTHPGRNPAPSLPGTGNASSLGVSPGSGVAGQTPASRATVPTSNGGASTGATSVTPLPTGSVGNSAKVVTTGSVDLVIGDGTLPSVVTKLTNLVAGDGGFVARSQIQVGSGATGDPSGGTMVLQVPQPSFAALLTQVQGVAKVTSVTSTSTDVTGQYVDLQARIAALQASRQQYVTILSRASSIGDILAVQSQLDTLQTQIEQLQGQLNILNGQTTYGTLTVSLSEAGRHPVPPPPPRSGLSSAWHDGIHGFVSGFEWLIRIAGPTLFVLICIAALAAMARWAWRTYRRRTL